MYEELKQWEYRVQIVGGFFTGIKADELEEMLNEWGEEGWEVVSTHIIENANKVNIIAKRPLTDRVRRERSRPSLF
jgi:hypothetical protein